MGVSGTHLVLQIRSSAAGSISGQTINSLSSSSDHQESLPLRLRGQIGMKMVFPLKIHQKRKFQYGNKRGIPIIYAQVQTSQGSEQLKMKSPNCCSIDLYHVLGLSFGATKEEIKASYRRLARLHHPDAAPPDGKDKSTQDFMDIHTAYTTLYNPRSKADYDRRLMTSMKVRNGGIYGGQQWRGRSWETDQCWWWKITWIIAPLRRYMTQSNCLWYEWN